MIDLATEETAALYVLGLLGGRERQAFEARLERDAPLAEHVRMLEEDLACMVRGLPTAPVEPSDESWERIRSRIREREPRLGWSGLVRQVNRIPAAWPMAACFLLTAAVFLLMAERSGNSDLPPNPIGSGGAGSALMVPVPVEIYRNLNEERERLGQEVALRDRELDRIRNILTSTEMEKSQARAELATLQDRIREMVESSRAYHVSSPGMARLIVIELNNAPPGVDRPSFSHVAREALSEALDSLTNRGQAGVIVPTQGGAGPTVPTARAPETALVGPELPPGPSNWVAPGESTGSGPGEVVGRSASVSSGDPQDEDPVVAYTASGNIIWDQDEQVGIVSVYDLPDLPEGHVNMLWLMNYDTSHPDPIPVGVLPTLRNNSGQLYFSLDQHLIPAGSGFSPINVLITQESTPEVSRPTGPTILSGPWPAAGTAVP